MSIKVVYLDDTDGVPESVREEIKSNAILAPLIGDDGLHWDSSVYLSNAFGNIPRHHPELLRIIEAAIIEYPDNCIASIEEVEGGSYFITASDGKEYVWSMKDFVHAAQLVDPELLAKAPRDFSNPNWKDETPVHNWHNHVNDEVQALWGTFTEQQKAALAIGFQKKADCERWD